MFGLLNLHKPAGITSRDAVNCVQRLVRPHKVGHAGTLDPLATGVLVIGVGPATRLVEYVQRMRKQYLATFLLGRESDTEDVEGDVRELIDPPTPTREAIAALLPQFIGRIEQRPPAYSALKVDGKRAYKLARAGEDVVLEARPIDVYSIEVVNYDYPRLTLDIACGSGTYVRSLGRDLAATLDTAAVMEQLQRTAIGEFRIAEAVDPRILTADNVREHLQSPRIAVASLPHIVLSTEEGLRIARGQGIERSDVAVNETEIAALDASQKLLAILQRSGPTELRALRNFAAAQSG